MNEKCHYPKPLEPKVNLISWTKDPFSTILNVWYASRNDGDNFHKGDEHLSEEDYDTVIDIISMDMPLAEMIDFIFIFDNISVTWREHVVRHRIGSRVGDDIGVDIIPELASSSFWSQAIRIKDMTKFFDNGQYRIPESIGSNSALRSLYQEHIKRSQDLYTKMVEEHGIEREDARELFPLGMTHRMSWKLNLASMKKVIGKRSCWIAQATLWHPIIIQMVSELRNKVSPVFRFISNPPCIKNNCFNFCPFHYENVRRINKLDKVPPCPMWMVHCLEDWKERDYSIEERKFIIEGWDESKKIHEYKVYREKIELFKKLWGRDVYDWSELNG